MIRTNTIPSSTPADQTAASDQTQGFLPQVGLLALDRQYATLRNEIRAAIERVARGDGTPSTLRSPSPSRSSPSKEEEERATTQAPEGVALGDVTSLAAANACAQLVATAATVETAARLQKLLHGDLAEQAHDKMRRKVRLWLVPHGQCLAERLGHIHAAAAPAAARRRDLLWRAVVVFRGGSVGSTESATGRPRAQDEHGSVERDEDPAERGRGGARARHRTPHARCCRDRGDGEEPEDGLGLRKRRGAEEPVALARKL
jgi:hypothetical protein